MKIKEFKEEIKFIGAKHFIDLEVTEDEFDFCVVSGTRTYATVSKHLTCSIDTDYTGFRDLSDNLRSDLLDAMYEFAKTPIEERESGMKYYLKHRFLEDGNCRYLNYDQDFQELYLNDRTQFGDAQTQFTKEEIDNIKKRYNTDLKDFEMIEVE